MDLSFSFVAVYPAGYFNYPFYVKEFVESANYIAIKII